MGDRESSRSPIGDARQSGTEPSDGDVPVQKAKNALSITTPSIKDEQSRAAQAASDQATAVKKEPTTAKASKQKLSDDDYLLADDDDDIMFKSKKQKTKEKSSEKKPKQRHLVSSQSVIFLGVVIGLCFGIWFAGRPSSDPVAANPTATSNPTVAAQMARIGELSDKLKTSPDDIDANMELGVLLMNNGDPEGAKDLWEKVTKLDPKLQNAWYSLGFYYLRTDPVQMDKAEELWQKAIDIDPKSDLSQTIKHNLEGLAEMSSANPTATSTGTK